MIVGDFIGRLLLPEAVVLMKRSFLVAAFALCGMASAYSRGMSNPKAVLIEKGSVAAGLSMGFDSWETSGQDGYNLLGILEGLDGYVKRANVAVQGGWFVKDNLSVGLRFGYNDTRISVDSTNIGNVVIPDRNIFRQSFDGSLTFRGYLPLFDGHVIAMFCEGRLSGSLGYSKDYKQTNNGKEGDYSDIWSFSAGLYPGISVFVTQNIAFEVQLPLLEGGVRMEKQDGTESDVALSRTFMNFKPNLIGLRMGLVCYF